MIVTRANLRNLKKVMEAKVKISRYARFEAVLHHRAEKSGWGELVSEFTFHPTRRWKADFAIPSAKLLIEIEGGFWMKGGGRHNRGGGAIKDLEKYNAATIMGYAILRFTPQQVNNLSAAGVIEDWFDTKNARYDTFVEHIHEQEDATKKGLKDD